MNITMLSGSEYAAIFHNGVCAHDSMQLPAISWVWEVHNFMEQQFSVWVVLEYCYLLLFDVMLLFEIFY